jgi:hypothetical protein
MAEFVYMVIVRTTFMNYTNRYPMFFIPDTTTLSTTQKLCNTKSFVD